MKANVKYLRTSTEEQNPTLQLKDCDSIAQRLDLKDCEVFSDKQSAWKDNIERESFEKIKQGIKRGEVMNLICWDLDRLYRNRKKLIEFFQFCKVYNCKIYSFRQEWLESINNIQEPFNEIMFDLMLSVMGWLAEEESNKKSERVKNAVVREDKEGNPIPTSSYKGNKWGRKVLSQEVNNAIINAFKQGNSLRMISKKVFYWDKNRNQKNVSLGYVHKVITKFKETNLVV